MIETFNKKKQHEDEEAFQKINVNVGRSVVFKKYVQREGYKIREIPEDRNCQFHAVSDQLTLNDIEEKTYKELRKIAVNQMKDNPGQVSHS